MNVCSVIGRMIDREEREREKAFETITILKNIKKWKSRKGVDIEVDIDRG